MNRVCSYEYSSRIAVSRDDVWMSSPYTEADREFDRLTSSACRYCGSKMEPTPLQDSMRVTCRAFSCTRCGYWFVKRSVVGGQDNSSQTLVIGEARHYDVDRLDVPIADLRRYLRSHPNDVAHVNPTAFEKLAGECVRSAFGPCEVVHVGGVGDRGIDLKLITSDRETFLIQVKRRGDLTKKEGPSVVRELNGVLFQEGQSKGIVITTASGFTPLAREATDVKTPVERRYEMKLVAFDDFVGMLNLPDVEPYEPWTRHLDPDW